MRKEFVLAGVLAVITALVCSMFLSTAMATTQKVELFSDDFNADEVDYEKWETKNPELYEITNDQLDVDAYIVSPSITINDRFLNTIEGYTNDTITVEWKMKKSNTEDNGSWIYGGIADMGLKTSDADYYGLIVAIMFYSYNDDVLIEIITKNDTFDDTHELSETIWIEGAIDTYYQCSIQIDRLTSSAYIQVMNIETGDSTTKTVTDLNPIDADVELGFGIGGAYTTPVLLSLPSEEPMIPAPIHIGYADNVVISSTKEVTPPEPTPATDRSKEIAFWGALIGTIMLVGAYFLRKNYTNTAYGVGLVGGLLIVLSAINYVGGYLKTVPYLFP